MAVSRSLVIAIAAMALLTVSIVVDVSVNRTYFVDVKDGDAWRTIGQSTVDPYGRRPYYSEAPYGGLVVDPNGTLELRLRADNGYPWALDEHYLVDVNGVIAAEDDITAPARGFGESAFTLSNAKLLSTAGPGKAPDGTPRVAYVYFTVDVGGKHVPANLQLQEAS